MDNLLLDDEEIGEEEIGFADGEILPDHLRLHDFQHYLDTRGLRNEPVGIESEYNVSVKQQRVEEGEAHQNRVHREAFGSADDIDKAKLEFLESFRDFKLILKTQGKPVKTDIKSLAAHCDAVYALASTRDLYKGNYLSTDTLELSLEAYSQVSVEEFVTIANGSKRADEISADIVVECCQVAHYLQCSRALEPLVEILVDAVDTGNCKSLLQFADRLHLPLLFERSLSHMMQSLSATEDVWEDLTPELRDTVTLMKKAVQSSILAGTSRLYFSSLDEYIVMFAETLEYHRERLFDAKERQSEVREIHFTRSKLWEYNQEKIERQEIRVRRLEQMMKEQKKIFGAKAEGVAHIKKRQAVEVNGG